MKTLLIILALAITATAQTSNVHAGISIGSARSMGFSGCLCGATAGFDARKGRFDLSADFDVLHVKKTSGGSGYEIRGHEATRIYFGKMFVEGGLQQSHYSVTQFSKTHYFAGAGAGAWLNERVLIRTAFLTHIGESSKPKGPPNNQNGIEGSAQFFMHHHAFFKSRVLISRFTSPYRRTGTAVEFQIGVWK